MSASSQSPAWAELTDLVSRVPEADLPAAKRMLQALLVDPLWLSIESAPVEDEELSAEGEAALAEALGQLERGEVVWHEEVRRELGR